MHGWRGIMQHSSRLSHLRSCTGSRAIGMTGSYPSVRRRSGDMYILTDSQIVTGPEALDQAWDGAETFAFVPHKSGVSGEWLMSALSALPPALHTHHFALLTSGSTGQ